MQGSAAKLLEHLFLHEDSKVSYLESKISPSFKFRTVIWDRSVPRTLCAPNAWYVALYNWLLHINRHGKRRNDLLRINDVHRCMAKLVVESPFHVCTRTSLESRFLVIPRTALGRCAPEHLFLALWLTSISQNQPLTWISATWTSGNEIQRRTCTASQTRPKIPEVERLRGFSM